MTPTVTAGRTKVTPMKIGIQYHSMTIGPAKSTIPVLIGGESFRDEASPKTRCGVVA